VAQHPPVETDGPIEDSTLSELLGIPAGENCD
jgi:hypothetical protein